ncbi:MAG: 2-dehydropantoate 2-reductase [Akkermansiaceae bacterium]|nr:2-dehydropantoate 2-reductase [Akkermansiaceae bacterium]
MSWNFNSVAVVGSGAIGLYYGGRLAEAGGNVSFLARSDFAGISENGVSAESVAGDFYLPDAKAFRRPEEIGPVDLVIVSWKSTANHALATVLPPLLHAGTQVLTLQNGLGNCERIAETVGADRVCGGLCFVCINRTAPGTVNHTSGGRLTIGEYAPGIAGRAEALAARFRNAKIPATATDDLLKAQWEKLIWNVTFNGLAVAEGGKTTSELLADPRIEAEIRKLMHEVVAAAKAQGIQLDEALVEKNIAHTRPIDAYRPSTMIDFVEGRELELDPIWEEPLRRANEAGVAMPALENLLGRIKARLEERD